MINIKITEGDRFVFEVIGSDEARLLLGKVDVYRLYDDDTEGMVMDRTDLEEAIGDNCVLGIEIGFMHDLPYIDASSPSGFCSIPAVLYRRLNV